MEVIMSGAQRYPREGLQVTVPTTSVLPQTHPQAKDSSTSDVIHDQEVVHNDQSAQLSLQTKQVPAIKTVRRNLSSSGSPPSTSITAWRPDSMGTLGGEADSSSTPTAESADLQKAFEEAPTSVDSLATSVSEGESASQRAQQRLQRFIANSLMFVTDGSGLEDAEVIPEGNVLRKKMVLEAMHVRMCPPQVLPPFEERLTFGDRPPWIIPPRSPGNLHERVDPLLHMHIHPCLDFFA